MSPATRTSETTARLRWAAASQPLAGESISGDLHVVRPTPQGAIVGVVDGVGHGEEAAQAARAAVLAVEQFAAEPIPRLLQRCNEALRNTRGAVMGLASFEWPSSLMTWLAVGNVAGVLVRARGTPFPRPSVLQYPGIVGQQVPQTTCATRVSLWVGDTIVFATDGIRPGFALSINAEEEPERIAEEAMARHLKGNDDALVLAARFLGPEP